MCGAAKAICLSPSELKMRQDEVFTLAPDAVEPLQRPGRGRAPESSTGFVLYSRRYCHLCDDMLAALQAQLGTETPITVVDVDDDATSEAQYGDNVPVLMYGQSEVCRHRHDAEKVAAYIDHSR
jgi:hypothetical protein